MDALGSQQTAVAMVTKQDQFLTLSRESLKTSVSPDGQPDDLYTNKNTNSHRKTGSHVQILPVCSFTHVSHRLRKLETLCE